MFSIILANRVTETFVNQIFCQLIHLFPGVYTTEIDLRQQKVTVIGNVEAETLIKKLVKTGKHAELWPVKASKKQSKSKNKKKNNDSEDCEEPDQTKSEKIANEATEEQNTIENCGGASPKGGAVKVDVKQGMPAQAELFKDPEAALEEKGVVCEGQGGAGSGGGGSGGGKKKKKKKRNNAGNSNDDGEQQQQHPSQGQVLGQVLGRGPMRAPANHSPPRHPPHQYPPTPTPHYYALPAYAVGHHTAHPTSSYAGPYYGPQPTSHSCNCYHDPTYLVEEGERSLPSDLESYSPHRSSTFELFSDENPNACSVM